MHIYSIKDLYKGGSLSQECGSRLQEWWLSKTGQVAQTRLEYSRKVNIHIIQCDDKVQEDKEITCEEDLKSYMENLTLKGEGGTDFRPAFAYVERLVKEHVFSNLRGLLYFTDGQGTYPAKMPAFETAFVFLKEDYEDMEVPSWAVKLILEESDIYEY